MNKQLYFAYGSNMDTGQMAHRCPGARKVGIALLNGYRFIINSGVLRRLFLTKSTL